MQELAEKLGAYYRRYCDDILWIVDPEHCLLVQEKTQEFLKLVGDMLNINEKKTIISKFDLNGHIIKGSEPLQYLGFTYDGHKTVIRSQSLSKFWRRAIYAIRSSKKCADKAKKENPDAVMYRRPIYRRFTHLGKGCFFSYVRKSQGIMTDDGITNQFRKHWSRIQSEFRKPL